MDKMEKEFVLAALIIVLISIAALIFILFMHLSPTKYITPLTYGIGACTNIYSS